MPVISRFYGIVIKMYFLASERRTFMPFTANTSALST